MHTLLGFIATIVRFIIWSFIFSVIASAFLKRTFLGRLILSSFKLCMKTLKISIKMSKKLFKVLCKEAVVLGKYCVKMADAILEGNKAIKATALNNAVQNSQNEVVNGATIIDLASYIEAQKLAIVESNQHSKSN